MKNNLYKIRAILFYLILSTHSLAEELNINAQEVQLNKETKIVYAEGSVQISDNKKNNIFTEKAEYNKLSGLMRSFGQTDIITSEKYRIQGEDIFYDNKKKVIYSNSESVITDINGNKIHTDMFNYSTAKNMFFSQG